jgi:hypothetical protein
MRRGRKSL